MALTRGNILDYVEDIVGHDSTEFRTFLEGALNDVLYALHDMHDWEWTHKADSFPTVAGTEEYDLGNGAIVAGTGDIRSSRHIECMWDSTNGKVILPDELRNIRKRNPLSDTTGKPHHYAPWGGDKVILVDEPDGVYTIKYLYKSIATESTADADNLETTLGIPPYMHHIVKKMVLHEGFMFYDDTRHTALMNQIGTPRIVNSLIFNAIAADMLYLESSARFRFWEEELMPTGVTYDDFLRRAWNNQD